MKLKIIKNKRGQAFSTFQLLIAAVVALALLGVLMPIIGGINPGTDRLIDALKERITTQQNQPGALTLTDTIKVSGKKDPYVSSEAIASGTGMDYKQVFFMHNGYINDFQVTDGSGIRILNESSISYQFGVICNRGHTLISDLQSSEDRYSGILRTDNEIPYISPSSDFDENLRACVVFPVKR